MKQPDYHRKASGKKMWLMPVVLLVIIGALVFLINYEKNYKAPPGIENTEIGISQKLGGLYNEINSIVGG